MDLAFAKELYYKEAEAKLNLDARLGVFAVLLSAVGGVVAFIVRSALAGGTLPTLLPLILSIAAAVIYFLAIIWVLLATIGYSYYKHVPYGDEWLKSWREFQEYHRKYPKAEGTPESDFDAAAIERFSEAAAKNGRNNSIRSERYYKAAVLLLVAIVLLAVTGLLQGIPLLLQGMNRKGP